MNDKELSRLSRRELLELMVLVTEENEKLHKQIELLDEKLNTRNIILEEAGSIAEAALKISGVIESVQVAADLYLENIRRLNNNAQKNADSLIHEARKKTVGIAVGTRQEPGRNINSINELIGFNPEVKSETNRWSDAHNA